MRWLLSLRRSISDVVKSCTEAERCFFLFLLLVESSLLAPRAGSVHSGCSPAFGLSALSLALYRRRLCSPCRVRAAPGSSSSETRGALGLGPSRAFSTSLPIDGDGPCPRLRLSPSVARGRAPSLRHCSAAVTQVFGGWGFHADSQHVSSWKSSRGWELQVTLSALARVGWLVTVFLCFDSVQGEHVVRVCVGS